MHNRQYFSIVWPLMAKVQHWLHCRQVSHTLQHNMCTLCTGPFVIVTDCPLSLTIPRFESLGHVRELPLTFAKAPFTPTGDVWRCTGDQQFWTHRQCIARRRQTTSVHCHHIASARQPSSMPRQAWRFFWNVQKNRQASPTVASE